MSVTLYFLRNYIGCPRIIGTVFEKKNTILKKLIQTKSDSDLNYAIIYNIRMDMYVAFSIDFTKK